MHPNKTSTTIHISMSVTLTGRAHNAYCQRPDEVIDELRQSLIGDCCTDECRTTIKVHNLKIQPQ